MCRLKTVFGQWRKMVGELQKSRFFRFLGGRGGPGHGGYHTNVASEPAGNDTVARHW